MTSLIAFTVLVALVALERLAELVVSKRNAAWSFERGGVETGQRVSSAKPGRDRFAQSIQTGCGRIARQPVEMFDNRRTDQLGRGMLRFTDRQANRRERRRDDPTK